MNRKEKGEAWNSSLSLIFLREEELDGSWVRKPWVSDLGILMERIMLYLKNLSYVKNGEYHNAGS